jgi:hypothetical protein
MKKENKMASIAPPAHLPAREHHRREEFGGALEKQLSMLGVQLLGEGAH